MDNIEHLIKIHSAANTDELESILSNYRELGFKISKIENIEKNKYTIYLEKQIFASYSLFFGR